MENLAFTRYTRKDKQLLVCSFLGGILFEYLFYGKAAGISFPLFAGAVYVVFIRVNQPAMDVRKPDFGMLLLVPIALLSLTYVLFSNEVFRALNGLAVPLLMAIQMVWSADRNHYRWDQPRFIGHLLDHLVPDTIAALPVPFKIISASFGKGRGLGRWQTPAKVLVGLLLALPLLIIVVALLSSADTMFARMINAIPDLFAGLNMWSFVSRTFVAAIAAFGMFGFMWGLLHPRANSVPIVDREREEAPARSRIGFDPTITITFLLAVNLVYVCFAVIQFSYFFAAGDGVLPSGTSYAEYARQGFAELVLVTIINLTILLVVLSFMRREARPSYKLMQSLLTLLVAATGVMLISAYLRLILYEEAYGFTYTRVLVHAFMLYLVVLFTVALYKIWKERVALLKPYIAISVAAYVIINYANIDVIIVRNNIARYEQSGKIDEDYLGKLSYDAVPALVRLNESSNRPEQLSRVLTEKAARLERKQASWTSWNWSELRAKRLLAGVGAGAGAGAGE